MPSTLLRPEDVAFLEAHRVAYLATVDEAGDPHIVPVCFAYSGGALYMPIDEKPKRADPLNLRRVRNILGNPRVCFTVDTYDEDWTRLAWLQVRGTASLATRARERGPALNALRARYPQYESMDLEFRPLIRVTPHRVTRWAAAPR